MTSREEPGCRRGRQPTAVVHASPLGCSPVATRSPTLASSEWSAFLSAILATVCASSTQTSASLGLVSLFAEVSSEIVYPLFPIFVTSVLGAPVAVLGLVEGIAEATASITKYPFGQAADYTGRYGPFVVVGYSLAAVGKLLIALSFVWPAALAGRFVDRLGKGMRTAARDDLIAARTKPGQQGLALDAPQHEHDAPCSGRYWLWLWCECGHLIWPLCRIPHKGHYAKRANMRTRRDSRDVAPGQQAGVTPVVLIFTG